MRNILVIRFGSLGDLCLLGGSLSRWADGPGGTERRLTLVTKAAFAPLMARVRGVDRVIALEGSGLTAVTALAARLRRETWDEVIDAHNILRGHVLLALLGRRPDRRLAKNTTARLALLGFGRRSPGLQRTMRDRFDVLFPGPAAPADDETAAEPALADLAGATPSAPVLGLAPGAQWASKRWPEEHWVRLLAGYRKRSDGPVEIFLGPREEAWFSGGPLAAAAERADGVSIRRGLSLPEIGARLAACTVLLTNDSGLLHLAEAVGTPVAAFYGPTVREFGYFPGRTDSRILERPLDCRPCSRNGKRPCHRGDLACLAEIPPDEVLETIWEMASWPLARPAARKETP